MHGLENFNPLFCFQYAVVTFLEEDGSLGDSEAIPYAWMFDKKSKAYWPDPPKRGGRDARSRLVMGLSKRSTDWPTYNIKYRHSFATYNLAIAAAKKQNDAEDTVVTEPSDLDWRKRNRQKPARYMSDKSDESGEELPTKRKKLSKKSGRHQQENYDEDGADDPEEDDSALVEDIQKMLSQASRPTTSTTASNSSVKGHVKVTSVSKSASTKITDNSAKPRRKSTPLISQNRLSSPPSKDAKGSGIKSLTVQKQSKFKDDVAGTSQLDKLIFEETPVAETSNSKMKRAMTPQTSTSANASAKNNLPVISEKATHLKMGGNHSSTTGTADTLSGNQSGIQDVNEEVDSGATLNSLTSSEHAIRPNSPNTPLHSPSDLQDDFLGPHTESTLSLARVPESSATGVPKIVSDLNCNNILTQDSSDLQTTLDKVFQKIDNHQKEIKLYKKVMAETLEDHKNKLNSILLNQAKILAYVAPEGEELYEPANMPNLLQETEEHLDAMETFLAQPANMKAFVSHLRQMTIDQSDEGEATYFLLKETISNNFARTINWEGGKGKIAFRKTLLNRAICAAQLKHFPDGKLKITKNKIQRWFSTSGQRGKVVEQNNDSESE